ncbi:MAG: histidine kinase [Chitinophagaceae bacterium]|nr:MAG: histidine kinase [Chitinophagaceae bacterium]
MIWLKENKIHILIWALFIFWEAVVVGLMFNNFGLLSLYVAHYLVIIILFYFQSDILLPFAVKHNRLDFFRVPLVLVFQLIVYVGTHFFVDVILTTLKLIPYQLNYGFSTQFLLRNVYRGMYFMGISGGYYFLRNYIKQRKHSVDLEKAQLNAVIKQKNTEQELFKAQNAFLKAQINPHFLFNTLSFIHNKVSVSSPEAADAVISLSEMMRYALSSDERGGTIILEDEMEQVLNLIGLFKLRKSAPLYLKAVFAADAKPLPFIPLILLTLTENMFKHGQLHDANHEATLKVYIENEMLCFETRNLSQPQKSNRAHTGLANIKHRLTYAYGESIHFEYATDADQYFTLKLGVLLEKLNEPVL